MRRSNRWLATAPLPVYFLFAAVSFGGVGYLLHFVIGPSHEDGLDFLIGGVVYGLLMTAFIGWRRRRYGGAQRSLQVGLAIKNGELPADADPAFWRPALARQERTFRRLRWIIPVEFGAFVALAVWLALTAGPVWWIFAGFFVAFVVLGVVGTRRNMRKITALQHQLSARAAAGG